MSRNACLAYSLLLSLSLVEVVQALEIARPDVQSNLGQALKLKASLKGGPELALPVATAVQCLSPECRDLRLRSRVSGRQSGKLAIEVVSLETVAQPAFVVRLSVRAGAETATRDVTVLLDPPAYQVRQIVLNAAPLNESAPMAPRRSRSPRRPEAVTVPSPVPVRSEQATGSEAIETQLTVQPGDTLTQIARRLARRQGGETRDWANRLWRDNPEAFINGDANRLKAGAVLSFATIATETTAVAAAPNDARTPHQPTDDTSAPSSNTAAPSTSAGADKQAAAYARTADDTSAARSEQRELQERLARMEQRLQALEDALLAKPTATAVGAATPTSAAEPSIETVADAVDADTPPKAEPTSAAVSTVATEPSKEIAGTAPIESPENLAAASPQEPALGAVEANQPSPVDTAAVLAPPPATVVAANAPATPIASKPMTEHSDVLVSAWSLLAGGGLACAGLLLLGLRSSPFRLGPRDRRGQSPAADEAIKAAIRERLQDEGSDPSSAEDLGPSTLDLGKLNRVQPGAHIHDSVISEVDVHIVYGAFDEAEAVLDEALATSGASPQLLVKLAEVYYYQRSSTKLTALGERMKNMELPAWAWAKVFRLGHDLCPDQAVFTDPGTTTRTEAPRGGKVVEFPQRGAGRG